MGNRVSFITLGCAKNEADSVHMQKSLRQAGYRIVSASEPADAVVVNTCSFIREAIEESLEVIFDVASDQAVINGSTKLVVCGCLPSRYGDTLSDALPEADCFVTCAEEDSLVDTLNALLDKSCTEASSDLSSDDVEPAFVPSAYVKISDGCDRHCSYCTIPFIRGHYHSFTEEKLLEEIEELVLAGTKEVVLIAQDSGLWGSDFQLPSNLAILLDSLARKFSAVWFRVMYLQPEGITDELLHVMASHPNICNYFDIPLQHCNPDILRSMNRTGSSTEYLAVIEHIREIMPDAALRTTLIVGYPGETEEQFQELCHFVEQAEFDYVGIFRYSPEEGTKAATLPNQIDEAVKLERFQTLRDLADNISAVRIQRHIGTQLEVLVLDTEEDGQLFGRAQCQAPEVDGVTYLDTTESHDSYQQVMGTIIPVRIVDTLFYEMEGQYE